MRGILRLAPLGWFFVAASGVVSGCGDTGTVTTDDGTVPCHTLVPDGGDTLPPPPDGPAFCPTGTCNYQTQGGCSASQACVPAPNLAMSAIQPTCIMAGAAQTGEACSTPNGHCTAGNACVNGICRKLCCGEDWSACDAGESCYGELFMVVNGDRLPTNANVCLPLGCDVLTSADCAAGLDCKIVDPTGNVGCVPASAEDIGEACEAPSICKRGLTCVGEPGQKRCRRLCRASECGEPACRPGEGACVHFNRNPAGVGECTPGQD